MQVLQIARQMKLLKLGTIALDDTKVYANASRHHALSHGRASQMQERLRQEVAELLHRAEQTDRADEKTPLDIPAELSRRETRLAAIAAAKAEIERRAAERLAHEQAEYEAMLAAREQKAKDKGTLHVRSTSNAEVKLDGEPARRIEFEAVGNAALYHNHVALIEDRAAERAPGSPLAIEAVTHGNLTWFALAPYFNISAVTASEA